MPSPTTVAPDLKDAVKISGYLVGTILLGCILAPLLWWGGQWLGEKAQLSFLTDQTFQRYFNRAMLIAAVALLWPAVRWLQIKGWRDFALERNPFKIRHTLVGFTFAFVLLLAMGMITVWLGLYDLQKEIRWDKMLKIPGTMIAVATLEELLFRGAMMGLLMRRMRPMPALLFVSILYSIVHFLKPMDVETGVITWASGFQLLPYSFHQFTEPLLLLGGFCTLFAIGFVLGQTRLYTRSLWMAFGMHAGWIAGNRVFNITFKRQDELMPWFGPRIEIGLAPLITVILTGLLVMWWLRKYAPRPRS